MNGGIDGSVDLKIGNSENSLLACSKLRDKSEAQESLETPVFETASRPT